MKYCPECGQPIPAPKKGRICGDCGRIIGKHDKWHVVASVVKHRDCDDPTGRKSKTRQPMLISGR